MMSRLLPQFSLHKLVSGTCIAFGALLLSIPFVSAAADGRFKATLDESVQNAQLNQNLPERFQKYDPFQSSQYGIGARDFFIFIGIQIVIPVFIFVGILFALIGFYKIMVSHDEKSTKQGRDFLLRGVVGTLLMVSAAYIV